MLLAFVALLGLHHVDVRGRFVDPAGQPVAQVRVHVGPAFFAHLPAAETLSGPDGRFAFSDVSTHFPTQVTWTSSDEWLGGATRDLGQTGGTLDLGDIRLSPNTIIRVRLQPPSDLYIRLNDPKRFGEAVVCLAQAGECTLRDIPFTEGEWEISPPEFEQPFRKKYRVQNGRRDQFVTLTLYRTGPNRGTMDVRQTRIPPKPLDKPRLAQGHVLAPDGSPMAKVLIAVPSAAITVTGEHGRFRLPYIADQDIEPVPITHSGHPSGDWQVTLTGRNTFTFRLQEGLRFALQINGKPAAAPWMAHWWHFPRGWQPLPNLKPWLPAIPYDTQLIRLAAPGRMPLVVRVPYKARPPVSFRDGPATRTLTVTAAGRPVPNAHVDVEWVESLAARTNIPLNSYRTDSAGKLRLEGAPAQEVEVFVSAEGYETAHALWTPDEPLTLRLLPRQAAPQPPPVRPSLTVIHPPGWKAGLRLPLEEYEQRISPRQTSFRLPSPGRYKVDACPPATGGCWQRYIALAAGQELTISAPLGTGRVTGPIEPVPDAVATSVYLLADDPDRWSYFPLPVGHAEADRFHISEVPPGNYHLFRQPLRGRSEPLIVRRWSGIPVRVEAGRTVNVQIPRQPPPADVPVEVSGVDSAVLRVIDPTADHPPYPYSVPGPPPPAIRLRGGKGALPGIQPGLLELTLELDDGREIPLRATVEPGQPLRLSPIQAK